MTDKGYHSTETVMGLKQARVENSFFRYKSVFGGGLKARHSKAQRTEAAIGCHILNRMAELGRPSSYALGR